MNEPLLASVVENLKRFAHTNCSPAVCVQCRFAEEFAQSLKENTGLAAESAEGRLAFWAVGGSYLVAQPVGTDAPLEFVSNA